MAAAKGEGEAEAALNLLLRSAKTVSGSGRLFAIYERDDICRFIELTGRGGEPVPKHSYNVDSFPWGDRRGRLNGHLVLALFPLPEIKKP